MVRIREQVRHELTVSSRWHGEPKAGEKLLARDAVLRCVRRGASVARARAAHHLAWHEHLKMNAEAALLGQGIGIVRHEPEHTLGTRVAAREGRAKDRCTARGEQYAAARRERRTNG